METVDEEFLAASLTFIEKAGQDEMPFFVWWNSTRMHIFTHLKKESPKELPVWAYILTAWWSIQIRQQDVQGSDRRLQRDSLL